MAASRSRNRNDAPLARGVSMPRPELVVIGEEVPPEAIAPGAVLHPFCQIRGERTRIGAGAVIGEGGPVVIEESRIGADARIGTLGPVTLCQVWAGPGTVLGAGAAEEAVFLGKEGPEPAITCGLGFRVRKGSLYEEDASSAQFTDTKMTVLFPWVTLGSNVNWCDLLMAGGTGPELGRFSEVGSGAVHFNFTPRGDKATASLLGEVCEGVFLRARPLFIGGNGSLIGPARVDYGAVTAAGRRHAGSLGAGLHAGQPESAERGTEGPEPFDPAVYGSIKRIFDSQARFIGELAALVAWYAQVRALLAQGDGERLALYAAGGEVVGRNLTERIAQLGSLAARMEESARRIERGDSSDPRIAQQRALAAAWPEIEAHLRRPPPVGEAMPEALRRGLEAAGERHAPRYTAIIQGLDEPALAAGRAWLKSIAGAVASPGLLARVPALGAGG